MRYPNSKSVERALRRRNPFFSKVFRIRKMPLLGMPRLRESSEIPQAGFNVVKQLRTSHALSREVANSQEGGGRGSGFLNIVLETAHPYEVRDRLSRLAKDI